jgi:hypothetical protein
MTEVAFNLDRELNIENNVDALAKKWTIHKSRGNALYFARPEPDREDAVIPAVMQGRWTKPVLLQEQINKYLKDSWDQAETAQLKAERVKEAAKKWPLKKEK